VRDEVRQFRETCTTIEDFNRDIARAGLAAPSEDVTDLRGLHFDERHERWLVRLSRLRDAAGAVSRALRPRLDAALAAIFVLLGLSALAFHVYAYWFRYDPALGHTVHEPWALAAFVALLTTALAVVFVYKFLLLEQRRLDGRALAEAMRVRRAWSIAGVGRSVAASYLGQLRGEMSWMRLAVLQVCPPASFWAGQFAELPPEHRRGRLEYVLKYWVGEDDPRQRLGPDPRSQLHRYREARDREHNNAVLLRGSGLVLAVVGWGLLAGLLIDHDWASHPWHPYLIIAGSLVIAGGLAVAYCERRAHEELAQRYERMAIVFEHGSHALAGRVARDDIAGAQRVVEELGREAIMEHSQWLVLRRSRPLELPVH
jgi:hypothetical protein